MSADVLDFARGTGSGPIRMMYTASSTATVEASEVRGETASVSPPPAAAGAGASKIVPVMDLGGPELRLKYPLHVNIEESDGWIVALSYDLELAEQGETEFEALDNLRSAILELFVALRAEPLVPGHLARKLAFLESLSI